MTTESAAVEMDDRMAATAQAELRAAETRLSAARSAFITAQIEHEAARGQVKAATQLQESSRDEINRPELARRAQRAEMMR